MQSHRRDSDSSMGRTPPSMECDLSIVLLEVSGAGKSSMGNAILGREAFKESGTRESEIQSGKVEDRTISIINTPGLFNDQLTDEEIKKQMMKSLELSDPGPHVFLLIVNLENFEEDVRNIVEKIKIFGDQALNFTMVVFIEKKKKKRKPFKCSGKCKELVRKLGGQYYKTNSINRNNRRQILKEIDEFIKKKKNAGRYCNNKIHKEVKNVTVSSQEKRKEEESREMSQEKQQTTEEKHPAQGGAILKYFGGRGETFQEADTRDDTTGGGDSTAASVGQSEPHTTMANVAGGSRCSVLTTVCLGLICVLLLVTILQQITNTAQKDRVEELTQTVNSLQDNLTDRAEKILQQHNTIMAQRDQIKNSENTVEGLSQTINSLQDNFRGLTTEKDLCHQLTKRIIMSDLKIMVVGKTGAGKSASGNTILGENVFEEKMSSESVTKTCQEHRRKVKDGSISVTDTPGLFDTKDSTNLLKHEIEKCVNLSVPGPHAFLLVIRLDARFTDEEKKTVKWIQENFGEKAADYSIILFTRGDQIDKPIEEFLTENRQIEEIVRQCKSRYHVFNNKDKNPSQVNELLDKIAKMVMENGGGHYTNEMYKEALKKQKEEHESRRLEEQEHTYKEALKRQREEDERLRLEEQEKMLEEAQKRQREEDEIRRLEEQENMLKEAQKRQKEEDERRRLEEELNMYKEAQKKQREEDERFKNTNDKRSAFMDFFSSCYRFIMDCIETIYNFII